MWNNLSIKKKRNLTFDEVRPLESDFSFFKKNDKIKNSKNNLKKLDFRGDSYGISTVYLTAIIGVVVFLLMAKSVISDAKLRVEVENNQITIIEGKTPQTFDIESSGFEFESHIYSGDSQHFLTILDPSDQKHVFDISGLGQIEVQELKALISSIQKPAPNKIQTQED